MAARQQGALRRLHVIIDALTVALAMLLAYWLHEGLRGLFPVLKQAPAFSSYALLTYVTLPLWLGLTVVLNLHRSFERIWNQPALLVRLGALHLSGLAGLTLVQFLTQSIINRSMVGLFLVTSFALMYLTRTLLSAWLRYQHLSGRQRGRLLLVGEPSPEMEHFVKLTRAAELAPEILGYLDDMGIAEQAPEVAGVPFCGALDHMDTLLHGQAVDQVVFLPPYNQPEMVSSSLVVCETLGVPATFAIDLVKLAQAVPRVSFEYNQAFVRYDVAPKHPEMLAVKHGLDWILALGSIVLLSPLLLFTGLAIVLSMGRPIFFSHERAGLYGRSFRMHKFRTMGQEAEAQQAELLNDNEMSGPVFKVAQDPRVTPLGRLLRKYSIDELPQLFNVLEGSMSLVGPRPLPVGEQDRIRGWQRRRLSMKPGLTGLWQVSGRSGVDFEDWMALDLQYVDDWSLGLDVQIMMRTVPVVLSGRGAH